ncbi:tetratricopeptide repeat protein [Zeaxanthinibacter enoshimensis]|uniref:Flp pilus assembly protein TadD n=1 Tax=Zeaxanthinibacter enoshimensis TaxID=392009 RepID=A0A4R6TKC1_9FLAO|nr:tetratricopeptide repeat protein [Zeaxanthinibacter enoshimensis]TDQ31087.1 Flp pilus assembly protein TadD [Zeaxanthinibacter enoshimensis]
MKQLTITLLLIIALPLFSQDSMESGFQMLEKGNYNQAQNFFADYLQSEPGNKTARICYGRALGLNGRPEEATSWFAQLSTEFPGDLEVLLNYNESFLWNGRFEEARPLYEHLLLKYPDNFNLHLGYANTLANLKLYERALSTINIALALKPGNPGAMTSKKYILLGHAYILEKKYDFEGSTRVLKEVLISHPMDKDALLQLGSMYLSANQPAKAKEVYVQLLNNKELILQGMIGLVYSEHQSHHDELALQYARRAVAEIGSDTDEGLIEKAKISQIYALLWNKRIKEAKKQVDILLAEFPGAIWVLLLKASLGMYSDRPSESADLYSKVLDSVPGSYDANLGLANALYSQGEYLRAERAARQVLQYFPRQRDALQLVGKLAMLQKPDLQLRGSYSFDNGGNIAYSQQLNISLPISPRIRTGLMYGERDTENSGSGDQASSSVLSGSINYLPWTRTEISAGIGVIKSVFTNQNYVQPLVHTSISTTPLPLTNLKGSYRREVQNFNVALLRSELVMNHYGFSINIANQKQWGWYNQLMHTRQSDQNQRNLVFSSVYHSFIKLKGLKVGTNLQYIGFKEQLPELYFSPEAYGAVEAFASYDKTMGKTYFWASMATGVQQVKNEKAADLFRMDMEIRHQFSERWHAGISAKYSNVAASTATGFEFTEFGLRLRYLVSDSSLFKKAARIQ